MRSMIKRLPGYARNYWITTHASNFPSSRPVWGIWQSPVLYFSSGSQIVKNIAKNPKLQLNLESGGELVIIEGTARSMVQAELGFWLDAYYKKYHWEMPESVNGVFQIVPKRVLAWISDDSRLDGGAAFSNSATEWRFS